MQSRIQTLLEPMERFHSCDLSNRSVINTCLLKRAFCLVPHIPRILLCCLSSVLPLTVTRAADPDFGPNVTIFDPTIPVSTIQNAVNAISQTQVPGSAQFDTVRHAFLFKPGAYTVDVQVGYYTSVAGLGLSPDDVTIDGIVHSEGANNSTLTNFWRSVENMHIVPQSGQTERWAVSQAGPFRRMHVSGGPLFWIMPLDGSFSSGGFIADSWIEDEVLSGSQQQWLTRNSILGNGWTNGVWNQVFSGVMGAPAQNFPPNSANRNPYTTLPQSPLTQEKPFLYVDAGGNFNVSSRHYKRTHREPLGATHRRLAHRFQLIISSLRSPPTAWRKLI
jgi:hypothetical protein